MPTAAAQPINMPMNMRMIFFAMARTRTFRVERSISGRREGPADSGVPSTFDHDDFAGIALAGEVQLHDRVGLGEEVLVFHVFLD